MTVTATRANVAAGEKLGAQIADLLRGLSRDEAKSALAHAHTAFEAREAQARLYNHLRGVLLQLEVYLPRITWENPSLFDLYYELSVHQRKILHAVTDELLVLEGKLTGLDTWVETLHQLRAHCQMLLLSNLTEAQHIDLKELPAITCDSIAQLMQAIPAA
jgi:hypothetical protein